MVDEPTHLAGAPIGVEYSVDHNPVDEHIQRPAEPQTCLTGCVKVYHPRQSICCHQTATMCLLNEPRKYHIVLHPTHLLKSSGRVSLSRQPGGIHCSRVGPASPMRQTIQA